MQTLRKGALDHAVERVPDNASRDKVKAMAARLLECTGLKGGARKEMEDAWANYRDSWPDWTETGGGATKAEVSEEGAKKTWFFHAAQLTYNCTTGDWASTDEPVLRALFERFKVFLLTCLAAFKPLGVSATMERSTGTDKHVHLHGYFHLPEPFRGEGAQCLQCFAFEGVRPHVEPNKARGDAYKPAVNRGHYYVVIDKKGSVYSWTNYAPFKDYGPESWWLDNWYKQGKLSNDVYLGEAARVGIGFQRRLGDIRAAERFLREAAVDAHIKSEQAALQEQMFLFHQYPEIDRFVALFGPDVSKHRRPMLAIVGGTNLGKSMLAAHVLGRIANMLGVESYLEVTVEGNEHLDLTGFDHRCHAGVLLDGVGDALFLRTHREVLQGRPKKCKGAQSATNVYAYCYTLARRAVIATFDLSAGNLMAFTKHHWLSDERNVICLRLEAPAYVAPAKQASSHVLPAIGSSPPHPAVKRPRPIGSPSAGSTRLPSMPPVPVELR